MTAILWHTSVVIASAPIKEAFAEVRDKVSIERSCQPGREIQLVLPLQEAARLDCRQLEVGLTEVLLWGDSNDSRKARMAAIWEDGHTSYFTPSFGKFQKMWIPSPPRVVFFRTLELHDKKIHARIHVETDTNIIIDVLKRTRNKILNSINYQDRLTSFVHLWTEVKYNFAFFDQVPEVNWEGMLEEYLPKVQKEQTTQEYYKLLQACFAKLNDGHTDIGVPPALRKTIPPLLIRPIEGKAIVQLAEKVDEIVRAGITTGMEITHIDGRSVSSILDNDIYPYICAGTSQYKDRKAYSQLLAGDMGSKVNIRFIDMQGVTCEAILTRLYAIHRVPFNQPLFEYKKLKDGIIYVALNSFSDERIVREFDSVFGEIKNAKGLIIDVRENGGGNSSYGNAIIGRLTDKPLSGSRWKSPQHIAAFKAWKRQEQWYEGGVNSVPLREGQPFLRPVVVVTGAGTISAAEDFLIPLHASGRAILVGEKTAGTTGQPLIIELPRGGKARICTKRDMYPDGREFVGIGIVPDIEVHPTQKDIYHGRDAILEKALQIIKEQVILHSHTKASTKRMACNTNSRY